MVNTRYVCLIFTIRRLNKQERRANSVLPVPNTTACFSLYRYHWVAWKIDTARACFTILVLHENPGPWIEPSMDWFKGAQTTSFPEFPGVSLQPILGHPPILQELVREELQGLPMQTLISEGTETHGLLETIEVLFFMFEDWIVTLW